MRLIKLIILCAGACFCFSLTARELPAGVDNSLSRWFPPVIDQKGGSCAQASNIGYMYTYEVNSLLDRDASLPENRFSYFYTWNLLNGGRDEGSFGFDGLALALQNGVISEADFPYQYSGTQFYWASGYDKYLRAMHYQSDGFITIDVSTRSGIDKAREYLADKGVEGGHGGVLAYSTRATGWTISDYSGPSETGYRCILTKLAPEGAHALTIVGYDDKVEFKTPDGSTVTGAFIVLNTWGEYFHDRGRFYLPYWFFLQDDIPNADLDRGLKGAKVEYEKPGVVFRVSLDYTSRDDLSFRFGVGGDPLAEKPRYDYTIPIMDHQGGDYPMQGKYASSEIEVGFNFTQYSHRADEFEAPEYFFCVSRAKRGETKGEGQLLSLAVYDYRSDEAHPLVYRYEGSTPVGIKDGDNWYKIFTQAPFRTSFSPVKWLDEYGNPASASLVFRTAKGKYAKVRVLDYDKQNGVLKFRYVYAPDGSRNLK